MEINLEASELDKLIEKLDRSPEVLREARRAAFEAAAPRLKAVLDRKIVSTIGDSRGKVRSWQDQFVGSKGGYAAVRPKKDTFTEPTKKAGHTYAVGYVTNAINSGHRYPGQSSRRMRGKTDTFATGLVEGRYFYEAAQPSVEAIAQDTVQQVVDNLIEHLEE